MKGVYQVRVWGGKSQLSHIIWKGGYWKDGFSISDPEVNRHVDIDFRKDPHQAVANLAALRNKLFHVRYESLIQDIPPNQQAVNIFNKFVYAMEDMNVILQYNRKHRKRVLSIALDKVI